MQAVGKGMEILDCEGHSLVIRIVDLGWHTAKSSKGLAKPLSQTPALRVSDSEHQEWGLWRCISKKPPKDAIKGKLHTAEYLFR